MRNSVVPIATLYAQSSPTHGYNRVRNLHLQNLLELISELEKQKAAIDTALAALRAVSGTEATKRRGRPPGSGVKRAPGRPPKKQVRISAEGRKRLAESMKKRWAAKRAAKKVAAKKVSKPRGKRTAQKETAAKKATAKKAVAKQPAAALLSE